MKEEIYSIFREYLTPKKGYRLLTIRGRESKTVIAVKNTDKGRMYQSIKGTVYAYEPEAVKRLEQIGTGAIEKIRESVEMNVNGESLFDSMPVLNDVTILLKAITASNKYSFDDLVDYCDNNIKFSYVVEYVGVKNRNFDKELASWYWSDDYYKVLIENSPYDTKQNHNNEFVKLFGTSASYCKGNNYEIYAIVNRDLEVAVLAGSKLSSAVDLAPNVNLRQTGMMHDFRNTADENNVLQYNTYLSDTPDTQLRKLSYNTAALKSMKFLRNKKLSLKSVMSSKNSIEKYDNGKNVFIDVDDYKKARTNIAQFNQIISDSKFGVKYEVISSLAFLRKYDNNFQLVDIKDVEHNIEAKLLVSDTFSCGYILKGTKFNREKVKDKFPKNRGKIIKKLYTNIVENFSNDDNEFIKDSPMITFSEINSVLYGCNFDLLDENDIFTKDKVHIKKRWESKKDDDSIKDTKGNKNDTNSLKINALKNKVRELEKYILDYSQSTSDKIVELENQLYQVKTLNSELMAALLDMRNNILSICKEIND